MSDADLDRLSRKTFAPETNKKITWVVKMYTDWRDFRNYQVDPQNPIWCDLNVKESINAQDLCFALTRFITEVRKVDGTMFPGKTLYEIIVCVQMHLETMGFNYKLIDDPEFSVLKFTLDNVMKARVASGIGINISQAQVITFSQEDQIWMSGQLGFDHPVQLLNTVVFTLGMALALRAGKEHRALRGMGFNSQIKWKMDRNGQRYFTYTEDIGLKTNKGGLKHRKVQPKVVDVYAISDTRRCPVRILYKYFCRMPINRKCSALYLRPIPTYTGGDRWFYDAPVGVNKLQSIVKTVCRNAGLEGKYTNHSLRSTAATRMYHNACDEQMIQEVTGHRSLAVRQYKRTSNAQKKYAGSCIFRDYRKYDEDQDPPSQSCAIVQENFDFNDISVF